MHAVAGDHDPIEGEAWFRAVPRNELIEGVFVDAARAGRAEAIEHCQFGVVEVWQPERSATIIWLGLFLAHGDGLPCRILSEYGKPRYDASPEARGATESTASAREHIMAINPEKVDEMTLALLYLTTFKDKHGPRAWKSHSWDVLDRLHENGYIHDPATKAKSVMLTEEGAARSKRLFEKHFMSD
ncbi:MAG: DUF6429 family protein [Candidatus Sulfotelmatobacter sp.]